MDSDPRAAYGVELVRHGAPFKNSYYAASFMHAGKSKYELYIDTGDAEQNRRLLSRTMPSRVDIERIYGGVLEWHLPNETHRYAAVRAVGEGDVTELECYDEFVSWFIGAGDHMRAALDSRLVGASSTRASSH